jgi:hypothetical protein
LGIHIETASFSGSSAVNINNVFSSTYDNYKIVSTFSLASGNPNIRFRMRLSGTDATGSNYEYSHTFIETSAVFTREINQTSGALSIGITANHRLEIDVFSPFLTTSTVLNQVSGFGFYSQLVSNRHTLGNSYDGLTIFPASSTISGDYSVYGYRKS